MHAYPEGPGDSRPTAMQIVKDEDMVNKLQGKNILITGASSGIGIETARALHATGAKLFLPVRNLAKAEPIREEILKTSPGKGEIILMHLDLEDLDSVRACMAEMMKDPAIAAYMKSPEQGASTTVWAAIGSEWREQGGKYLEDVAVAKPWDPSSGMVGLGYAETAYQPEGEEKLWKVSCELVGVPADA